jgi:hypothetical protein
MNFYIGYLFKAVLIDDVKIAKQLLEAGADPNEGYQYQSYRKIPFKGSEKKLPVNDDASTIVPYFTIEILEKKKVLPLEETVERNMVKIFT